MATTQANPETRLLGWLRGKDERNRNAAFTELLADHGVRFGPDDRGRVALPAGGRVNEQPGSIVQQAAAELWEKLDDIAGQCRTDDELRNLFGAIIKRRRIDRVRRKKNRGAELDPARHGAPASERTSIGSRLGDTELHRWHVKRLLDRAAKSGPDPEGDGGKERRKLVECYVVRNLDWPAVAAQIGGGVSVGALKVRFTRLRPALVEGVYEDFLAILPPSVLPVARALLVDGQRTAEAAKTLRMTEPEVRALFTTGVLPKLWDHFGKSFLQLIPRLQRRSTAEA